MFDHLPPPRELPPGVRAGARQRVGEGIAFSRGRSLAVTGVAAAVVLTAVGVPLVAGDRSGTPTGDTPSAAPTVEDPPSQEPLPPLYGAHDGAAPADLRRCDADGWEPLWTAAQGGVTVVTLRSGAKIRFCELTPETVTLSVPATAPAAGARITYRSASGTVAGLTGTDVSAVHVRDREPLVADDLGDHTALRHRAFVLPNGVRADPSPLKLQLGADDLATMTAVDVPLAAMPAVVPSRTDNPQPDRGGLPGCARRPAQPPLVDAHAWTPAAPVTLNAAERVRTARYAGLLAICVVTEAPKNNPGTQLIITDAHEQTGAYGQAEDNPYLSVYSFFYDFRPDADNSGASSNTIGLAGMTLDERVARVTLEGAGDPITATVADGQFLVPGVRLEPYQRLTLAAIAADGTILQRIPVRS